MGRGKAGCREQEAKEGGRRGVYGGAGVPGEGRL